ncbi:hypothetical protein APSETT444_004936 [Aspergillus pseudonomiae]
MDAIANKRSQPQHGQYNQHKNVCRGCAAMTDSERLRMVELQDKAEMHRFSKESLFCADCKVKLPPSGPRWWICLCGEDLHRSSRPSSQPNITQAPDTLWEPIGPGKAHLLQELEALYWAGVESELENIIRTLKVWQQPEYADINISDENDINVHGFDTFLDQVCQEARAFAIRYGETKLKEMANLKQAQAILSRNLSYQEALKRVILDTRAEYFSRKIKEEVREQLNSFLDIDKLIEHRPPLDELDFWKRPAIPQRQPKRYKALMKQIVGAPFTGVLSQKPESEQEKEIIELLVAASKQPFDNPGLPVLEQQKILDAALNSVLERLRDMLSSRVKIYLTSIAQRLLDPANTLTWSATSNNCQNFCNSLIDTDLFEPLANGPHMQSSEVPSPLYLMSFVCPPEGYLNNKIISKFDVPIGLTEEYLLRFHYGRHDEADLIDTLQEYWYDWGAFDSTLYNYQDLFPWDCTEAYRRYPTKCGDCNLSKHVWAFPFDSWSIIGLHLYRDKHMYQPKQDADSKTTNPWLRDRLTILTASSILARAATAMAKSPTFCKATAWLHSKEKGLRRIDPSLARVKLGGIHRAQPFSHYFEAGTYSHYFLAEWALKKRNYKIADYETLRDGRAKRHDIRIGGGRFSETGRQPTDFNQSFDWFRGLDHSAPDYEYCGNQGPIETDAQFEAQANASMAAALIADSQLGSIHNAEHAAAQAAVAAVNCGSGWLRQIRRHKVDQPPEESSGAMIASRPTEYGNDHKGLGEFQCKLGQLRIYSLMRDFEMSALESYSKNAPNQDHLLSLPKFNIQRAIIDNTVAMGMTMEWMNGDDAVSIFNMQGPGISEALIPASLRPTIVQRRIPHHPWLDFFPFPNLRDNLIAVQDEIDDEELCHDLMAFWDTRNTGPMLLVWGPSWMPGNWEMTPAFVKKWGFLLGGCEELLQTMEK